MFSQVEVSRIEVPKKWRTLKKACVSQLAESLTFDGLLQPVGVRPHPKKEGYYELVYGRHRLEAAKSLGWTTIDTKCLFFDDGAAASATNAENLFRNELSAGERVVAFKSQKERYVKLHPSAVEHKAAGIASGRVRAGDTEAEKVPSFAEYAETTTGVPAKTVERYVTAGTNLTEEQLGVLAENPKVTLTDIKAINKLEPAERVAAVNMIAVGVPPKDSIAQVTAPEGTPGEAIDGDGQAEEEMSDEAWLETYCGEVLARLKYAVPFKRDAVLYRQTRDARQKFKGSLKKLLAQSKVQVVGPFYRLLAKTVNVDHPSRWLPCGPCGGSGMDGNRSTCHNCRGDAFVIRTAAGGGR